ncbi:MFS transporter [Sphingobacterium rhinopitheci]|uniref:MFS transporter n=1 Tax=Sphingobacterium rhinopitheci TaxID=2781960 RepID=UPI001F5219FD|nr:MFS transporter [Sphingobacterium rhinopitheci]MCI0922645.1 MFS transporter [Sphingobacterium rhinopitheci]
MNNSSVDMDTMPLTWRHVKVFIISSLGQFLGSGLATLIGVIIPMIQIVARNELTSLEQGFVSCMSLLGIMVGSSVFGSLSDQHGYLKLFRLCPALIFVASLFAYFTDNTIGLAIALFVMGLGIGGEYSIGSDYISQIMPKRWKLVLVGASKATAALGSIMVAILSYFLLMKWGNAQDWPKLMLIITVCSFLMLLLRIRFAQSPGWLIAQGRIQEAEKAVKFFLGNNVTLGSLKNKPAEAPIKEVTIKEFFLDGNKKKIIFSGIPWACEGLGVYGIGIFLPILVISLGLESSSTNSFEQIINSIEITTYINIFILIGFIIGLLIVNRFYHVKTQMYGFFLAALGLIILLVGFLLKLPNWVSIIGFLVFEICLNAGPHLLTFIIPQEIYPIEDRGTGDGLAASIGKMGGVIGVFFIPLLLSWGGATLVLVVSIIVMLIGGLVTYIYGKEVLPDNRSKQ